MKSTVAAKNHVDSFCTFSFLCIFIKFFCFQVCYFFDFLLLFFAQFTDVCITHIFSSLLLILFILIYSLTLLDHFSESL